MDKYYQVGQININIQDKTYKGQVYIDTPKQNNAFTKPDDKSINIRGWAVSNDSNANVNVYLDGNSISNIIRVSRPDVDSAVSPYYGGNSITPKAGYEANIDINNLVNGNHVIKVDEISRFGHILASNQVNINIQNKTYQGLVYIDTPKQSQNYIKQDNTQINIRGWAVSNDNDASIKIYLDGNQVSNFIRVSRPDVDSAISNQYGGTVNTPKAGFESNIDISSISPGNHIIKVEEISKFGKVIAENQTSISIKNIKYNGEMCLDNPISNSNFTKGDKIPIAGWAVSQDENAIIEIYIDNIFQGTASRYYRADIEYYNKKYDEKTINAGFGKLVDSNNLSEGIHTILVYEKSKYGDVIGGVSVKINVKSKSILNSDENNNAQNNTAIKSNTSDVVKTTNKLTSNNNTNISGAQGIDVSQYQGVIDWKNVANSGMKYAMIRIGYRGYGTGTLVEDPNFKTNFQNAINSGLKVGVYFYSTSINETEAKKDAEYVYGLLKKYGYQNKISMPIAIDLELISGVKTRDKGLSKVTRTNIANTFCSTIESYGYIPMVYACTSFLNNNLNSNQIPYDIWVAQYNSKCTYKGNYTMWQYSSSGKISGISGNVDCDICYKNY